MEIDPDRVVAAFAEGLRQRLGTHLKSLILFGSQARGEANADSDYDFLVVLDERTEQSVRAVRKLETELLNRYDALSGSLIYGESEWELHRGLPIGINIAREGIRL